MYQAVNSDFLSEGWFCRDAYTFSILFENFVTVISTGTFTF